MRPGRTWGFAAITLLALCRDAEAAPLAGPRCEREPAEAAYISALDHYDNDEWKEAVSDLDDAIRVCPIPDGPWSVTRDLFREDAYVPFYYLGSCHLKLQHLPDALRSFYLASCFGEPARDKELTKDLGSLAEGCRIRIRKKQKPQLHPDFIDGFAASRQKDWEEAAENMWDALLAWEEDGTMTADSAGRFRAPYLPRFRLADALFQLGCYQQACSLLGQTKLEQTRPKGSDQELKRLAELTPQCRSNPRDQNKPICRQWRCWLNQGSP